jgi:MFS family permease
MTAKENIPPQEPTKVPPFWLPLRHRIYRNLWLALLIANLGVLVHSVAAGWLMTQLTSSPLLVSLIQAATALPIFLFGLPAGALADIVDRRRYLLGIQIWLVVVSVLLGVLTMTHLASELTLLVLTFALGIGTAMMLPAWAATVPALVPSDELPQAAALSSVGMNSARLIGPAIGGALVMLVGSGPTFFVAAIAFCVVGLVLFRWRYEHEKSALPSERFFGALRTGFRYASQSPRLRAALVRSASFVTFAAAPWALLPLIVRTRLNADADVYGVMLALVGLGALIGAFFLPRIRARWSNNTLVRTATVAYAVVGLAIAWAPNVYGIGAAMLIFGSLWISVMSSIQVAAQTYAPSWVKARALSIFQVVLNGAMALGSVGWGWLATHAGLPAALSVAAVGALVAVFLTRHFELAPSDPRTVTPSRHLPAPMVAPEHGDLVEKDPGPVLVTVQYKVNPLHLEEFRKVMEIVERSRRRGGAFTWGLFEDVEQPGAWIEFFLVESWVEHLRQHERITESDRLRSETIRSYLMEGTAPQVGHYVAHGAEAT